MTRQDRLLIVLVAAVCIGGDAISADEPSPSQGDHNTERFHAMTHRAQSLRLGLHGGDERLPVNPEPLFRYVSPVAGTVDGTLWVWTEDGRPLALLCLFIDEREGFKWNYELVSLTGDALVVSGRPGWSWTPARRGDLWQSVEGPVPAASTTNRLVQMKAIARSHEASNDLDGNVSQLRQLPQPVMRYSSPRNGVIDGAVFLFSYGVNPEIAMIVEATSDSEEPWRVWFGRISAAALTVKFDGRTVWTAAPMRAWIPTRSYYSQFGPDPDPADASQGVEASRRTQPTPGPNGATSSAQ